MSQEDWMPTFLAAAGVPDVREKLMAGYKANGKTWKIHPDGYNFLPFFKGEVKESPREEIYYFSQGGDLNAIRVENWKIHFAVQNGNIATGVRSIPGWPVIVNLRADPYEKGPVEGDLGYLRWYADNMWTFVPAQLYIKKFIGSLDEFPYQEGSNLNAAGINYQSLRAASAMQRLKEIEGLSRPGN
jgi:arylsulfatase